STFGADLGHTAIFGALCSGATLHLIAQERFMDAQELGRYFAQHYLDYLKITPTHLTALLAAQLETALAPECQFILGGEALPWALVDEPKQRFPSCRIFNHYGPAEATIGTLFCPFEQDRPRYGTTVPLG